MLTRLLAFAMAALAGLPAWAEPAAQFNSTAFWFENWGDLSNGQLLIVAPDGQQTVIEAPSGTPVYRLPPDGAADGAYRYTLSAATSETETIVNQIDNGRGEAARDERQVPFQTEGRFLVERGVIVAPEDITEDAQ